MTLNSLVVDQTRRDWFGLADCPPNRQQSEKVLAHPGFRVQPIQARVVKVGDSLLLGRVSRAPSHSCMNSCIGFPTSELVTPGPHFLADRNSTGAPLSVVAFGAMPSQFPQVAVELRKAAEDHSMDSESPLVRTLFRRQGGVGVGAREG